MRLLQKVFIRSKEEQKEEMKLSYLCIMFFLYLSNIITAQEKDTITVLLIGDSTTKGATPRRVKPNGIHLEAAEAAGTEPSKTSFASYRVLSIRPYKIRMGYLPYTISGFLKKSSFFEFYVKNDGFLTRKINTDISI